ncbi:MAG: sigma-70 family RNA polymerase sigma factor [Pyrinomonadaceae bacterium]|nr:sigma-70 family RNA polymerase sigma factor [Pyrinomonadaceae bacterium]
MQFSVKIPTFEPTVISVTEKHKEILDESVSRLLMRAGNSRGLQTESLRGRVSLTVEKYLLKDEPNPNKNEIKEFIDALNADDLCLIVACENGDETAWEDLVKKFDSTVKSAARSVSNNSEDAEDLASSIWAELYGLKEKDGKAKGKLSYYSGRGSLAGWLRAVVSQLAVDQFRKQSKFVQIEETREFENLANESSEKDENTSLVAHGESPEEILSRTETNKDVKEAFREAMKNLEAEDRLILKLYYFDDLKLKDIGQMLGFHEATASRKLVRIQQDLRKSVEKGLAEKHGWKQDEVKKHLANSAANLDISLEKMFGLLALTILLQEFFK